MRTHTEIYRPTNPPEPCNHNDKENMEVEATTKIKKKSNFVIKSWIQILVCLFIVIGLSYINNHGDFKEFKSHAKQALSVNYDLNYIKNNWLNPTLAKFKEFLK